VSPAAFFWTAGPPNDVTALLAWVIGIPVLGGFLALPQMMAAAMIYKARQNITRWMILLLSMGILVLVLQILTLPFEAASSMAGSTMMAPMVAGGYMAFPGALMLWLERRLTGQIAWSL
jgi:hypothetical protein